jgi:hypothetical protein
MERFVGVERGGGGDGDGGRPRRCLSSRARRRWSCAQASSRAHSRETVKGAFFHTEKDGARRCGRKETVARRGITSRLEEEDDDDDDDDDDEERGEAFVVVVEVVGVGGGFVVLVEVETIVVVVVVVVGVMVASKLRRLGLVSSSRDVITG